LVVIVPRLFPADVQTSLRALLSWSSAGHTMTVTGAAAGLLGLHLYRRALRLLTEQRTGLSITS
jgi:hypothetical protein